MQPSPGDRLDAALDRLVERGVLDQAQAGAVRRELAGTPAPQRPEGLRLLGEIAGYIGASFVVGATLLFLSEGWDALGRPGRFAVLAVMAVALFGGGAAVRGHAPPEGHPWWRPWPGDTARRRLSGTLMTGAAAAAGFAAYVILDLPEVGAGGSPDSGGASLAASLVALAVVVAGYLLARSALGQLGTAVAAFAAYGALLNVADVRDTQVLGLGMVALGALWAVLAWRRLVTERAFGLAVAVTFGVAGAQTVAFGATGTGWFGYVLTAVVAAVCFAAYARSRDWIVLAGGVTAATLVVPEVLYDVTDGSLGASGLMLAAGITLLTGGVLGVRTRPVRRPAQGVPS